VARRLREHAAGDGTPAARAGQIIRALSTPPRLDDAAHARIARRVAADGRAPAARRWQPPARRRPRSLISRAAFAAMLAAAVVLAGIAANAAVAWIKTGHLPWTRGAAPARTEAARVGRRAHRPQPGAAPGARETDDAVGGANDATAVASPPPTAGATVAVAPRASSPAAAALATAPPPVRTRPPGERRLLAMASPAGGPERAHAPPAMPPASPVPDVPSPLAQESRLLARVLDLLRASHDYAGALTTLDEYDARFPAGVLRREAAFARLDALTALGRTAQALALLDAIDVAGPRAVELLVLRGELRGAARRYREATADFDQALGRRAAAALQERALYGRASCRLGAGDLDGSARDLQDYLSRFPQGLHAADVRRRLNR
jgi:hypothetical protein